MIESRSSTSEDFTNMIALTVTTSKEKSYTAGAIFGRQDPRIVRIDKFTLEAIPEGNMLVLYNYDKPGVIGNLGHTLGDNHINIARLQLSRQQVDGQALVVLSTDSYMPDDVISKVRALPNVISVKQLEI